MFTALKQKRERTPRIIHYLYEDGSEAAPDHVDTIEFIRTVTINEATGVETYGEWKPRNDDSMFEGVKSPEIENYSADTDYVEEVIDVSPEEEYHDIVVMYTPRLEAITETKEVTQTIHYVYEDGTEAAPDKRDTVTFTRNGMKNLATGEVTYDDWQAKDDDTTFDEVVSPEIDNYLADNERIETVTGLTADDKDSEITVTYRAKTTTTTETKEVTQTIHYVYEDGTEAASNEQSLSMKQPVKPPMVIGKPKTMTPLLMRWSVQRQPTTRQIKKVWQKWLT